jgi:hypothetical protein
VISSDHILFAFSLLGLFLVPAVLGRAVWAIPAGLAGVSLFILFAPANLHPHNNPWVHLLLSQGPWMLLVLDLVCRGNISRLLGPVSLRAWLAFALFRFMGLRFIVAAITGDLNPTFAVEAATGEFFAALGALILWVFSRPQSRWYRGLLIFWNTYALIVSLTLNFRILRADGNLPFTTGYASREVHAYFATWPNALDAYFWIPLSIGIHAAIFYTLVRNTRAETPAPD